MLFLELSSEISATFSWEAKGRMVLGSRSWSGPRLCSGGWESLRGLDQYGDLAYEWRCSVCVRTGRRQGRREVRQQEAVAVPRRRDGAWVRVGVVEVMSRGWTLAEGATSRT